MVVITSRSPLLATITAPAQLPRPSAHQLRRRQTIYSDLWATCGYADGDPDQPATCGADGSCLCQITAGALTGVLGHCSVDSSCQYYTACQNGVLAGLDGSNQAISNTCGGSKPYCQYLTWTNSQDPVSDHPGEHPTWSAWQCGSDSTSVELSWANGSPTRTSTKSATKTSSKGNGKASSTASATATNPTGASANSTDTNGDSSNNTTHSLSVGAIGGIVAAAVVFLIILIGIIVWIWHHRRTKRENQKRLSSMQQVNNFLSPTRSTFPSQQLDGKNGYYATASPWSLSPDPQQHGSNLASNYSSQRASSQTLDGWANSEHGLQSPTTNQDWGRFRGATELSGTAVDGSGRYGHVSELSGSSR